MCAFCQRSDYSCFALSEKIMYEEWICEVHGCGVVTLFFKTLSESLSDVIVPNFSRGKRYKHHLMVGQYQQVKETKQPLESELQPIDLKLKFCRNPSLQDE